MGNVSLCYSSRTPKTAVELLGERKKKWAARATSCTQQGFLLPRKDEEEALDHAGTAQTVEDQQSNAEQERRKRWKAKLAAFVQSRQPTTNGGAEDIYGV